MQKVKFLASGCVGALLLAAGSVALAIGGGSAKANTIIALPSGTAYLTQTVADTQGGNGYLFISANSEIFVTNLAGTPVATIDAGDGISGLAVSPDGATLYAAVSSGTNADSVAAITVSTIASGPLSQTFYPLAAGDQPSSLAVQGGKVWVSYTAAASTPADPVIGIGAIDPADAADPGAFNPAAAPGTWTSSLQLAADPDDTGVLVAVADQGPATAATYDTTTATTTDPATPLAAQGPLGSGGTVCGYPGEIAVAPGGKRFAAACDGPANVWVYGNTDITAGATSYAADGAGTSQAIAVAVDADGTVAVANRTDIHVYQPNGTLLNTLKIPAGNKIDEGYGLEWVDAPGGPDLAAVYQSTTGTKPYTVEIFDKAELTHPKLTLTPHNTTVNYKTVVHLTATLGATHANRSLTIYAEVNGSGKAGKAGKEKVIATGKVNAKGQLTVAYTALRSTTFLAAYAGDAEDTEVQATTVVSVKALAKQKLSGQYGTTKSGATTYLLYHHTAKITVAATVTPGHPGACVKVETQAFAKGTWQPSTKTACATLSPASKATISLLASQKKLGIPYRVRIDYVSDGPANASSTSAWQPLIVKK